MKTGIKKIEFDDIFPNISIDTKMDIASAFIDTNDSILESMIKENPLLEAEITKHIYKMSLVRDKYIELIRGATWGGKNNVKSGS